MKIKANVVKPKTKKEIFFEAFPNAPKSQEGNPQLCPEYVGLSETGEHFKCENVKCSDCWNRIYKE